MKKFKSVFLLMFVLSLVLSVSAYAADYEITFDKPVNHTFASETIISDGTTYRFDTFMNGTGKATVKVYFSNNYIENKEVYRADMSSDGVTSAFAKIRHGQGKYRVEIIGDASTYVFVNMYN